jgi:hypothetical protein
MKWNISGAFIGKLTQKLADAPKDDEKDLRSLVFPSFMVLPLLPTGALCQEIKFSGSAEVGINNDSLGSAVDHQQNPGWLSSTVQSCPGYRIYTVFYSVLQCPTVLDSTAQIEPFLWENPGFADVGISIV